MAKMIITAMEQPPYSPDLVSCEISFHQAQQNHQNIRFKGAETIKKAITMKQRDIPEEAFQQFIETLQKEWESLLELRRFTLKLKPYCLLFEIEIKFFETSPITFQTHLIKSSMENK